MNGQTGCSSQGWHLRLMNCWGLASGSGSISIGTREQRLITFVALHGRRRRSYIAGVLWPESTERRAHGNLRASLFQVQRNAPGLLDADRTTIDLAEDVHVDVDDFRRCVDEVAADDDDLDFRAVFAILDSGELAPGWYDDWVVYERERLQHDRVHALEALADAELRRRNVDEAVIAARAAATVEPLRDSPRAIEIRAHLEAGNTGAAICAYRAHAALLRRELGIEPSSGLRELVEVGASVAPGVARAVSA
jgi:DNA-binding SARP family transcriptional activator